MALKKCKECGNDVSTEAAACPKCGAVTKKKSGFLRFIGGAVLIFITLVAIVALVNGISNPPKPATPQSPEKVAADAKAAQQQYETCKTYLEKAKELDVLYDMTARGASIKVLVGPTFFTVPIDTKQKFAATVNCVLVKGTGGGMSFDLLHWQTGKKVASWNGYRLDVD
jgi:hypothetical protein